MNQRATSDLEMRLAAAVEALRVVEERAIAGQLALEVMHEIKNPLEALGHLIYLTHQEATDCEKVSKYMTLAQEQIVTLNHIAGETLGFARNPHSPMPIDFVALAEAALRVHRRVIEAKQIHLVKDLPEGVVVQVHTSEILQVISNLVANALDALPERGTLRLRVRRRGNGVQFLIVDNGHGIEPTHTREIFQPFFTTKEDRGTGLGLALSKKIIEHHFGKISVRSSVRDDKSGTAFRVSLPATLDVLSSRIGSGGMRCKK
jgi:signal transduction histidine kinase